MLFTPQPETEGAIARSLHEALEKLQSPPLRVFLDQYDLDITAQPGELHILFLPPVAALTIA